MNILWEVGFFEFLFVTVFLGGGAAFMTGRAIASTWQRRLHLALYLLLLACAVRFFHYALFGGRLLSAQYFAIDLAVLLILGSAGYRITRAKQMTSQYAWLFERSGPFSWRRRPSASSQGTQG